MSDYYDDKDCYLSQEEVLEVQEEYRQKRLIESIIGPTLSTTFHIGLIILLAIYIGDTYQKEINDIEVTIKPIEETLDIPKIPDEPDVEIPVKDVTDIETVPIAIDLDTQENEDSALEDVSDDIPQSDDDIPLDMVSDVTVSNSPTSTPMIGGRGPAGRAKGVQTKGGSEVGQDKLMKALFWLQKVQNPNGSWGIKNQQAYTGLALLTYLAHGDTHLSKTFGHTVQNAMQWLAYDQVSKKHGNGYGHAIKAYALAEAYAMTGLNILEKSMNDCLRIIIDGQQEGGSFHYGYNLNENEKQDLSVAGWNYQALKAAYGAGCEESGLVPAIHKAMAWLKKHGAGDSQGNGFPYNAVKSAKGKKHTMRAVGVLCLQLYGEGNALEIQDEIDAIAQKDLANFSFANAPQESLYGWYYATQAMFQKDGQHWKAWSKVFEKELAKSQNSEGYWEYPGKWHGETNHATTDRVYATTLCALMLTVYYRYLPGSKVKISERAGIRKKVTEEGLDLIE